MAESRRREILLILFLSLSLVMPSAASSPRAEPAGKGNIRIPKRVQIVDPRGDANFLPGDQTAPEMSGDADILRAWFTHDDKTISAHIQTATAPPGPEPIWYFLFANPDPTRSESNYPPPWDGECLLFRVHVPAQGDPKGIEATLRDYCDELPFHPKPAEARVRRLPDGSGLITVTAPLHTTLKLHRDWHPYEPSGFTSDDFAPGGRGIFDPYVLSRVRMDDPHDQQWVNVPPADQTKPGSSYRLPALGWSTKRPKCDRFTPAPMHNSSKPWRSLRAPIRKLTDRTTKNDPLVVRYRQTPAGNVGIFNVQPFEQGKPNKFVNIQIVSRRRLVGLHAKLEWPTPSLDDLDVWVSNEDGKVETYSETFNPVREGDHLVDPKQGYGGPGWEYLVGEPVPTCAGYTVEIGTSRVLREMPVTMKIWLGRIGRRED